MATVLTTFNHSPGLLGSPPDPQPYLALHQKSVRFQAETVKESIREAGPPVGLPAFDQPGRPSLTFVEIEAPTGGHVFAGLQAGHTPADIQMGVAVEDKGTLRLDDATGSPKPLGARDTSSPPFIS
jgi:hypothetical protein